MDDSIRDSERLNIERHEHRHRNIRKKLYCSTDESVAVTGDLLLRPLIDFLKDPDNPFRPPSELEERLHRIPDHHPHVALAVLAPMLDGFARDREDNEQALILNRNGVIVSKRHSRTPLAEDLGTHLLGWLVHKEREMAKAEREAERARRYKELTGKRLSPRKGRPQRRRFNHSDWTASECVVAGDWMLRIALSLPCFGEDEDGRIYITPEWQDKIDKICEDLLRRHPVMLPHRKPPPDWTEWWKHYGDRLRAKFIRSCHPDTKKAVEETLPFAHADGLNALKNVPLRINQDLVPLVHKFAVELMGHIGDKRTADRKTVKADLVHARWCDKDPIYLDYNCDDRGQVYPIQQLHFAREDHVRGLFEFARGAPLSADGVGGRDAMHWLEIHAANYYGEGSVDKKPWADRLRWTKRQLY